MYYAAYNPYGMISFSSFGGRGKNAYTFLAFPTKKAREEYLAQHEWDGCNLVMTPCPRKDVEYNLGKAFIIKDGVCKNKWD